MYMYLVFGLFDVTDSSSDSYSSSDTDSSDSDSEAYVNGSNLPTQTPFGHRVLVDGKCICNRFGDDMATPVVCLSGELIRQWGAHVGSTDV